MDIQKGYCIHWILNDRYQYTKNGVGSAIVNELIDYLTTLKYKEVRLGWINGNLQAEHFWIKNGFCSIKEGRVVLANRLLNKFFTD